MNRMDRLFAILLFLQGRRRVRARDLAQKLEVSERTIYRDVEALSEAGVPLVALPGAGYELAEGFYLPPLVFTPAEASALSLGARLLAVQASGRLPEDATRALEKILSILPADTRREVDRLTEIITFLSRRQPFNLDDPRLVTLQEAIHGRRVLRVRYHGYSSGEITERTVEPRELQYSGGAWYLSAFCRIRQGVRAFRVERMDMLEVLPEQFSPRASDAGETSETQREPVLVRIRFASDAVRWVREWQHHGFQSEEPTDDDGAVVMRYLVDAPLELRPWLLSWGAAAEVLEPEDLRSAIREEVRRIAERYV